ncbi:MAG: hypothetical protein CL933_10185 [Deltaproteobacteria bacterium]|nr:hypothetical protein [Deltaproteobacteria bacterium]
MAKGRAEGPSARCPTARRLDRHPRDPRWDRRGESAGAAPDEFAETPPLDAEFQAKRRSHRGIGDPDLIIR